MGKWVRRLKKLNVIYHYEIGVKKQRIRTLEYKLKEFKMNMKFQRLPTSSEVANILTTSPTSRRRWMSIVKKEENKNKAQIQCHNASFFLGFCANSTFPQEIARGIASYIKKPIQDITIQHISQLVHHIKYMEILKNGRGGEGLHLPLSIHPNHKVWLMENQQPRLCFSQPEFCKEIRNQAHISLYQRLHLRGNIEEQLSTLFMILYKLY